MKKRVLSLLLVLVMVCGMLPTFAMAEEADAQPQVVSDGARYDAFVASNLVLDGQLSETAWRASSTLSGGQPFDILWDGENLYAAVVAAEGDSELTVALNGETIATAALAESAAAFEVQIPYDTYGVETVTDLSLTVGESSWTGDVNLMAVARAYKPDFGGSNFSRGYDYFDKSTDYTNLNLTKSGDTMTLSNVYKEGAPNLANARIYVLQIGKGFDLAENRTDDRVIEFDFMAESLPAYKVGTNIGIVYAAYGLAATISDSNKDGIQYGIMKSEDDGKLYMVFCWQDVDSNPANTNKHVKYIALDKVEGEKFSVRLVWTAENDVSVYIDGQLKGVAEDCLHLSCLGASTFGFDLWGPGAALDGTNDNKFTISNVRIGKPAEVVYAVPGEHHDAFMAQDIVVDGALNEMSWRAFRKLSGGQCFDILWDGTNLYVGAEAAEGDSRLTVKVGNEIVADVAPEGEAFEVRIPYAIGDRTELESVTLTIGGSGWKGSVALVKMARSQKMLQGEMTTGADRGSTGTVTADGDGIVFNLPAISAANSTVGTVYAMRSPVTALTDRDGDVALEFRFDPVQLPNVGSNVGVIGKSHSVWAGLEMLMADSDGNGIICGIANGNGGLFMNVDVGGGLAGTLPLGRTLEDGAFEFKLVWKLDGSVEAYVDGASIGSVTNATNTSAQMDASSYTMNNMLHLRGSRYDYTDVFVGEAVEFTLSNVKTSQTVSTTYVAAGTYEAHVANEITVDGVLNEGAWRTEGKLGAGQPFDILWDGDNLYFAVEPGEGDSKLTVKLGEQQLVSETLPEGAAAFEVQVPFNNYGVETLEQITLKIGDSIWNGDVVLSKMARVNKLAQGTMTCGVAPSGTGASVTAPADGDGLVLDLPAISAANGSIGTAYALITSPAAAFGERTDDVAIAFNLDPSGLPVVHTLGRVGKNYTVYAGLEVLMVDKAGSAVQAAVANYGEDGLYFLSNQLTKGNTAIALGRSASDGSFDFKLVWKTDDSIEIFVNGVSKGTVAAAYATSSDAEMGTGSDRSNDVIRIRAVRYDYTADYLGQSVNCALRDVRLIASAEVTYSSIPTLDALLTQEAVTVDGALSEVAWLNWLRFGETDGNMAAAWSRGNLYLAAHSAEGESLQLSINGKEAVVDLVNGTIAGYANASIVKNSANGVCEIGIPLSDIGFNPTDYNQTVDFSATLIKNGAAIKLNAEFLNFSGSIAEVQTLGNYTKNSGPFTLQPTFATYIGAENGKEDYMYKVNTGLDHSQQIVMSNDFRFDALPISDGTILAASRADGFYYYFSDEDATTRLGRTVFAAIFTPDGTNLKLRIGNGVAGEGEVFDLNRTLGETFRVTFYWNPDDTLEIFVDGVLKGILENASYATSYMGVDVVSYRYYSDKVSSNKVNLTISNQTKIVRKYNTVLDELTPNVVFGRTDLDHVQKNLNMVTSYTSANFEALQLRWTTTDASVVAEDGTITRHATEARSAVVTVYYVDDEGNETELWSVTITVDPMSASKAAAPATIHTAFTADGTVKLDGILDDEGWLLNGWVLNEAAQAAGYFGTQWDQENLYVALDTESDTVTLSLSGKGIYVNKAAGILTGVNGEIAVSGTVAEIRIPVSEILGVDKIETYDRTLTILVRVGDSEYNGKLLLSNVDWWATDNLYSGLPMLDNNVKSVREIYSDLPDGNQGAKQLENGYRFYDLYNPDGENPAGIRTYVLFMKMPVYENFADRTEATYIEFDFDARALPAWDWDEAYQDGVNRAFSNYGMTFSLSDKADAGKNSNVAVFGVTNTDEGLCFVARRGTEDYLCYPMGKQVGEMFRLGLEWKVDGTLVVYIDNEEFVSIPYMSVWDRAVGDTSFVVNMLRNKVNPTSEADNMEVYLTNIAFGKAHSTENVIRNLTFDTIRGENEVETEITSDLYLPASMTNGQLAHAYPIVWTSSDPSVIDPATGKVHVPASGAKSVKLIARLDNHGTEEVKSFDLIVVGETAASGNVLVVIDDTNPFGMDAYVYDSLLYYLDDSNNSIVYAFEEKTAVNLVTLHDLDGIARLNRESLRLFVSDDNRVYTEIETYKLHHDGTEWYLYGFEAEARYFKVHYTHRDTEDVSFINTIADMITAEWDDGLVIPADAAELAVPATTLLDEAVAIALPNGIDADNLRVALNGELLFHYVETDGTVIIRIPDPTTGTLKLWNAGGIEIADKENVYEVTYGTRETLPTGGRWVLSVKAGTTFPDGSSVAVDTLYNMGGKSVTASTDGGYTWTAVGNVTHDTGLSSGGWGIDSKTGRMFHEFYGPADFVENDFTKSVCETFVFYSDDGGKTWTRASGLGILADDPYSTYVLSYTDLTELYGNDGEGPNVDFVFPMGAQYNNNGAFCGRVAYTTDGGKSWSYSESVIVYGNETAFEGGVSEATILQREDGTLVYYARCQSRGVDNFTISYSLDYGVTWLTPGLTSGVYTVNTQALMMTYDFDGFDGNRTTGVPMFMWGGNNVLGGNCYFRNPLNFATSTNEMDTFRDIQNIFFETFMEEYKTTHYITNASIQQINGDDMYVSFSRLYHGDSIYMVVNDFTNWFVRTKGAYDSFEHGTAQYEGWISKAGSVEATTALASEGEYSMRVNLGTQVTRSVPYLQNGTLSIDLYADANSDYVLELQPAFAVIPQKCAVISAAVSGTTMTLHDGTVLNLQTGWNTVSFELNLMEDAASIRVNGGAAKAIAVDSSVGDWISNITILAITAETYVDELLIIETEDVVLEATEADKAAANAVIDMIKDLEEGDNAAIKAAKEAFGKLTQVQQDLVDRYVPTGTTDKVNEEGALINYYDVLMALLEGVEEDEPFSFAGTTMTLGNDLSLNFMILATDVTGEGWYAEIAHGDKVTTIDQSEWITSGDYVRIAYNGLAAKQMTDEVTVTVYGADGIVLATRTDSIRGYAMRMFGKSTAAFDTVLADMLNYGAAAQVQFNYRTDDLANSLMTEEQKALATESVEMANIRETAEGYVGTTLELQSNILLNFFFTANYAGKTATVSYTDHYGVDHSYEVTVEASGSYGKVSVNKLVISDCSIPVTVTVDGISVTDSAESYCARVTDLALREPLMKFATSARAYFSK